MEIFGFIFLVTAVGAAAFGIWAAVREFARQKAERVNVFRTALEANLANPPKRKGGLPLIRQLQSEYKVPNWQANKAAKETYRRVLFQVYRDLKVTASEGKHLQRLRDALDLDGRKAAQIEEDFKGDAYEKKMKSYLKDGHIDEREARKLARIRKALGIGEEDLPGGSGDIAWEHLHEQFVLLLQDKNFSIADTRQLTQIASRLGVSADQCLDWLRRAALDHFRELVTYAKYDGRIDPEEKATLDRLVEVFDLPRSAIQPQLRELERVRLIEAIRGGDLPQVEPPQGAAPDVEYYLNETSWHHSARRDPVMGRLLISARSLQFSGPGRTFEWKLNQITNMERHSDQLILQTRGSAPGTHTLTLTDPGLSLEVLLAAINRVYQPREPSAEADRSRYIARNVVRLVWTRDEGKCRYCGSTEDLELDHIIPFSKGGSNTANNIHLLCLPCNRSKSAKV